MAVKAPIKSSAVSAGAPVKAGNGKALQRKAVAGKSNAQPAVQRKEQRSSWLHLQAQKPVNARPLVQPKIKIHAANDHFEKEADHVADRVIANEKASTPVKISRVGAGTQRKCANCDKEEKEVQACQVQRKCSSCEEKAAVQTKPINFLQTKIHSGDNSPPGAREANTTLTSVLSNQSTRGSPLPSSTREHMEQRMGADFSQVRIHTSPSSHEASTAIGARAFTNGAHIHFSNGEFNPQSQSGKHLLAHELTHTIQQGASKSTGGATPSTGPNNASSVSPKLSAATAVAPGSIANAAVSVLAESGMHNKAPPLQKREADGAVQCSLLDSAISRIGELLTDLPSILDGLDGAKRWLLGKARRFASFIPGYTALGVILGQDPITGEAIERNGRNFIEAGLDIIPGGGLLKQKLEELGAIDRAATWIDTQLETLAGIIGNTKSEFDQAWNALGIGSIIDGPLDTLRNFGEIFERAINNLITFAVRAASELLEMVKQFLLTQLVDFIKNHTNAYELLKVIIGHDPITQEQVERNGTNILNALLELGGEAGREQRRQMQETGTFQKAADWIDRGIAVFGNLYQTIRTNFGLVWDTISIQSLMEPVATFNRIYETFAAPVRDVLAFVEDTLRVILGFIKEALMTRLSAWARTVRGYPLVTVIIGKDPFTDEVVPRTIPNIIRGFMSLMEGGEEQYRQMEESGAIGRATQRIHAAVARLNMSPATIVQLFTDLWNSFSFSDLAHPVQAFQRILARFGEPIARLVAFVVEIVKIVIEVILQVMNFPFDLINNIITRAMAAFERIKRDPIGFLKNLLKAIKQGFSQFFSNILTHLRNGLIGWLMSELRDANVQAPQDFTLRGVISWVLQVLGISMEAIWQKLAAHPRIGPERVARLRSMIDRVEGIWTFIRDVQQRGVAAIWDKIQEQLSNLWSTVLDAVKNWIMERIINQMTARLLSMLDPTGIMAVVNSAIAIYRAIQSFMRYLRQMLEVVNSFVNGVADIAEGNTATAANYLESTMGRAMPIVIGFLANQVGLSGIGRSVAGMIGAARQMIDRALTWLVNRAVDTGFALFDRLMSMGREAVGGGGTPQQRLDNALNDAQRVVNRFAGTRVGAVVLSPLLAAIRLRYGLQTLEAVPDGNVWAVEGALNPRGRRTTTAQISTSTATPPAGAAAELARLTQLGVTPGRIFKDNPQNRLMEIKPMDETRGMVVYEYLRDVSARASGIRGMVSYANFIRKVETREYEVSATQLDAELPEALRTRAPLREDTKNSVRSRARRDPASGRFLDANTDRIIEPGREHFGHKAGHEWRAYKRDPANRVKTRTQVIEDQNRPEIYQIEHAEENLSHRHEADDDVQTKKLTGTNNEHHEREADHIADKVTAGEKITSPVTPAKRRTLQRKVDRIGAAAVTPAPKNDKVAAALSSQSTRGSPLPKETRTNMENRMGADFSKVRVHTGGSAHQATTSIGARAFTSGANIHFANGEFNPNSKGGKHLLAHELAHTMQQGAAPQKTAAPAKAAAAAPAAVKGARKVVAKPKQETKVARVASPHNNAEASSKEADEVFAKKINTKKPAKLSANALKNEKGKKLNKDPVVLPKKEEKKKDKPARVVAKTNHLQSAKGQQAQLGQLVASGVNFKPDPDKKAAENPVQKAQELQSKKISEGVLAKAAASATAITLFLAQVRPRLNAASFAAIARVKANELAQKEKIATSIQQEKAAAKKAMQQAAGSISGYHTKVISEVKAAAIKARADIAIAKAINTVAIELAAMLQLPKIDKAYQDAKKDFEASGSSVGNACSSSQNQRSWNEFISKMKHEDDSLLDGPYTDDQKQARGDAAVKVGDGYKEGLVNAGKEQAGKIEEGKPNDYKKVADAKTEMLKGLNAAYDTSLKGIDASEKSGISQADSTKKSMLNSVYTQHKAAQAKLDLTAKTQTQFVEIVSLKQSQQIELQANQAAEAMEEGGAQSLAHLNSGFKEYKQVSESMNSPPPALLQQKLQPIETGLAGSMSAMLASLATGINLTQAGFGKTANETITTTNTTVTAALAEAKVTNANAIDGFKKLQSAAVSSLQGIGNNNKKAITSNASQCVTDIQNIKTAFDGSLTQIATDLTSGLKAGSEEFKKGLQSAVDTGTAENKSMLTTSQEKEQEAADQVEPRWKSALKILLVIVVVLVIALVVGPAVIGFIGAAAGGGAFGAAVGAVVGGAILGAASSAVITVGNNLIDGKTWYKGVGHAMLEGAITGAIGGAFGAAGGGLAGKLIGTAAKGIAPALGRFAIQQGFDFAGNVVTEYTSSKLQGKPFSWSSVAQAQGIGVGMHIGMGGLGALKDVKGFKTINNIMEGSAKLGTKWGGAAKAKFSPGVPKVEAPVTSVKTNVEEPHGKGPSAPENTGALPKEEIAPVKPVEEKAPGTKPAEEASATGKPAEEVKTTPKEEAPVAKPKEEPVQQNTAKKEKPANLTPEEVNDGIVAKHPTEDGHNMKVTEGGMLVKCSTCEMVDFNSNPYKDELPKTKQKKFAEEWNAIQKETNPEIKAQKAAEFDARLNAELENYLSEGALIAKKNGYPPAPDGYKWNKGPDGEPFISRNKNTKTTADQLVFDKENNTFAKPEDIKKPTREVELLPKKTQAELEEIAKGLDAEAKNNAKSNTLEHKAARWEEYKARPNEKPLSYEAWSNMYDSNMNNALRGNKVANEVHSELGWGKREVTVEIDGQKRRLDIADPAKNKGVEVKAYESGKVGSDSHVLKEIELDGKLIKQKDWEIEWIFKGCEPTDSIRAALEAAGIKITITK